MCSSWPGLSPSSTPRPQAERSHVDARNTSAHDESGCSSALIWSNHFRAGSLDLHYSRYSLLRGASLQRRWRAVLRRGFDPPADLRGPRIILSLVVEGHFARRVAASEDDTVGPNSFDQPSACPLTLGDVHHLRIAVESQQGGALAAGQHDAVQRDLRGRRFFASAGSLRVLLRQVRTARPVEQRPRQDLFEIFGGGQLEARELPFAFRRLVVARGCRRRDGSNAVALPQLPGQTARGRQAQRRRAPTPPIRSRDPVPHLIPNAWSRRRGSRRGGRSLPDRKSIAGRDA